MNGEARYGMVRDGDKVAGGDRSVSHCGECVKMETGVIGSTNDLTIPLRGNSSLRVAPFTPLSPGQDARFNSIHLATDLLGSKVGVRARNGRAVHFQVQLDLKCDS